MSSHLPRPVLPCPSCGKARLAGLGAMRILVHPGAPQLDRLLYECPKCHTKVQQPINAWWRAKLSPMWDRIPKETVAQAREIPDECFEIVDLPLPTYDDILDLHLALQRDDFLIAALAEEEGVPFDPETVK